jgi:hypothetical protein
MIANLLLAATLSAGPAPVQALRAGETVYLYGPEVAVQDVTPGRACKSPRKGEVCVSDYVIALGWMDPVEVLAVSGDKIKFKRYMEPHQPNIGIAPRTAILRRQDFEYLKNWDRPGTQEYCESDDCFKITIESDATFTWEQVSPSTPDSCDFWLNNDWVPCRVHGYVFKARNVLLFEATDGNHVFMQQLADGLCRIDARQSSIWRCDTVNMTFTPASATKTGSD